jgi:hypothetical protein
VAAFSATTPFNRGEIEARPFRPLQSHRRPGTSVTAGGS